ncbi:hypothetical protein EDC01DRAFT_634691 [Geopyxis carbonaria]|nr:hypothetical protein EDC01DRAFT_634691 [Geopyxis carbonaria]
MLTLHLLPLLAAAVSAAPFWDGRIPTAFTPASFDTSVSPYNTGWNKGANVPWADIISFPTVAAGLFDANATTKPFELSINDKSIFTPGSPPGQIGFRRSELMPSSNSGSDETVQGVATLHWSMRADTAHPLNYTHNYELVFLETQDYASHVFTLTSGKPRDGSVRNNASLRLMGTNKNGAATTLHDVDFTAGVWHNYAVQIDFDGSTLAAWYSTDKNPLKSVAAKRSNDATGKGQYHIGMLKLPTGATSDVVNGGYQPSGINEGIVYGGVFIEKGTTVTLS